MKIHNVGEFYWVETKENTWNRLKCIGWMINPHGKITTYFDNIDYRVEAQPHQIMTEDEYMAFSEDKNRLANYMPDILTRSVERIYDAQKARHAKIDARAALTKKTHREAKSFAKTFDKWRADRKRISQLRSGEVKERFEYDWGKIGLTIAIQICGIGCATIFGLVAGWPISVLIVLGTLMVNYAFLKQHAKV